MRTSSLPLDHSGLGVLPLEECRRRLQAAKVGRVSFVDQGEPVILPVNHALDGEAVVFRTAAGSKLTARTMNCRWRSRSTGSTRTAAPGGAW